MPKLIAKDENEKSWKSSFQVASWTPHLGIDTPARYVEELLGRHDGVIEVSPEARGGVGGAVRALHSLEGGGMHIGE